ncbi:glycosyl hydrolase family 47-domain-containing protein [Aspergillus karnatakaensis]|uniref:class I alpha-mannosidase 1A n=1 Tax=Aspergillus karnatakaensis TaxID=1810916 RepID=UPI003CCCE735
MFRARRYRIFVVFAVILILLILHFNRSHSHDQPAGLQVPPPHVDQEPPLAGSDQVEDTNGGDSGAPGRPQQPSMERPDSLNNAPDTSFSGDTPSQGHGYGGYGSQADDVAPSKDTIPGDTPSHGQGYGGYGSHAGDTAPPKDIPSQQHGSSDSGLSSGVPSQDHELSGHRPQTGAQTQGKHGYEDEVDDTDTSSVPHWKQTPERYPIDPQTLIKLPTGSSKTLPKLQAKIEDESSSEKMTRLQQLDTVKSAFLHAWNGYKESAMGHDEVKPLHGGFKDPFNGWGATLVDSLDTLWIMGLKQEFSIAVDYVKNIDFTASKRREIPVFETVIRYLGGLLGAYDISGHKYDVLLEKAVELAEVIMAAFDTPNRMPTLFYKWSPDYALTPRKGDVKAVLAEIGSLSLEFTRLAQLTKDDKYYDAIARITNNLEEYQDRTKIPGLWPLNLDASGCRRTPGYERAGVGKPVKGSEPLYEVNSTSSASHIARQLHEGAQPASYGDDESNIDTRTPPPRENCFEGLNNQLSNTDKFGLGALGDSTYEYLPKEYMLLGGNNEQYQTMYTKAMDPVRDQLVYQPMLKGNRDVRFLATVTMTKDLDADPAGRTTFAYEGTHLTCFAGGMFAIGSKLFGLEKDLNLGSKLTDGCIWAYEVTNTGIMPEAFKMLPCEKGQPCDWSEEEYYLALDPYADKRPSSHSKNKRSPNPAPEKGNWHVIATPETTPAPEKPKQVKSVATDENGHQYPGPVQQKDTLTHEEFVEQKILHDRLPPGMTGISSRQYLLRPEAIESVFIMFRLTGDSYWREKGWQMFKAIDKATKTELAHSAIADVTAEEPRPLDSMESFWLAETLKYFYLLFSDPNVVSLDEYVLNTEAHPFKRPEY